MAHKEALYEDCILFLVAKAYQGIYCTFKNRLKTYGLTPSQMLVLVALMEKDGLCAGMLSNQLSLDNATLSGILSRLKKAGWIFKTPSEDDRRLFELHLTQKAEDHLGTIVQEIAKANEEVLCAFGLEEKLLFKRMLRDLQ
ncbi:MAG: MarR family transcriptional regulator [Thermodesulfobacteriota bacterium]|nr:MarR family transcriptional regulator [Thermodesulfobacteriota bacterium]